LKIPDKDDKGQNLWVKGSKQSNIEKVAAVQNIIKFNNVISPSNLTGGKR